MRPAFSYQKLTRAAINSKDASGLRSSKRSKSPSSNSNSSNSPGANEVPAALSSESGKIDKAATFGGSPLSGSSASGEELSQSMPALKTTRSYNGDSPESKHVSAKDSSSSPAPSKSGTAKSASGRAMSNVELLRMQEDIKLDKQLRALELHEREAKEEETRQGSHGQCHSGMSQSTIWSIRSASSAWKNGQKSRTTPPRSAGVNAPKETLFANSAA